jgi:hypothetical protein
VERLNGLIKRGNGMQALEVRLAEFVNESRECFKRVNICNQSKLFQDKYKNRLNRFMHCWNKLQCL